MRLSRAALLIPVALLLATTMFTSAVAAEDPPIAGSFIQRNGAQLTLDGQPYTFRGVNIYNANSHGWCWYPMNSGPALDDALTGIGGRKNVMRAWFFQSLAQPTPDSPTQERTWEAFDHTLATADAHGLKVVVTLTDQWGECGDGGLNGYKSMEWYQTGYQQPDEGMLVSYRDWVQEVVTRYRDDPRVAFWQLINEAEVSPVVDGVQQACPPGNEPAEILKAWTTDVAGLVKSIDSNHLVSLGTIGGGQCGAQSEQYQFVHDIPEIDLCEYHDYSPTQAMPGDQWNGLQVRLDQCAALDKPLFVGEVGIIPNSVGGTLQARADALLAKLEAQSAAGVQGFLAWAWNNDGVGDPASYDIGPGDPILDVLRLGDAPFARDDEGHPTRAGTTVDVNVLENDADPEGDALVVRSWTQPAHGSVTCTTTSCQYAADVAYEGPDSFTYTIADGTGRLAQATVAMDVWLSLAPSLVGESLQYEYADSEGVVIEGTTLLVTSNSCDRDGISTLTFEAGGTAYGPYPGTFEQSGTIVIGPQAGDKLGQSTLESGQLVTFDTVFSITSGDIQITGEMQIASAPAYSFGTCGSFDPGTNPFVPTLYGSLVDARSRLDMTATITTPVGSFTESGETHTVLYENDFFDTEGSRIYHYRTAEFFQAFLFSDGVAPVGADPDVDDDGVDDSIGLGGGAFDDGAGTTGTIVDAAGHDVLVAPDPDGVRITVAGTGTTKAVFTVCGFTIQLLPGSEVVLTCGSITTRVISGAAEIVLADGLTLVSIPAGVTALVDENPDGSFSVEHLAGAENIGVTVDGVTTTVAPGDSLELEAWDFVGFAAPIDAAPILNVVKAGQSVPLKWRLLDADGVPVTDLAEASLQVQTVSCLAGSTSDQLEEVASSGSALQNLGNGYYQLNWKTPKTYANSCKTLRLNIGDGVFHEALFRFTK